MPTNYLIKRGFTVVCLDRISNEVLRIIIIAISQALPKLDSLWSSQFYDLSRLIIASRLRKPLQVENFFYSRVETNLLISTLRKTKKYEELTRLQQYQYDSVKFTSQSISTFGVFFLQSNDVPIMLKETGSDDKHINYNIKTLTGIAMRSTCNVFCK